MLGEFSATTEEVLAAMTYINQIGQEVGGHVHELKGLIDKVPDLRSHSRSSD